MYWSKKIEKRRVKGQARGRGRKEAKTERIFGWLLFVIVAQKARMPTQNDKM